jgi:hypothetical protein
MLKMQLDLVRPIGLASLSQQLSLRETLLQLCLACHLVLSLLLGTCLEKHIMQSKGDVRGRCLPLYLSAALDLLPPP